MLLITRGHEGTPTGVLREQRREMAVVVEVGAGAVPGRTVHRPARQDHERHRAWPVLGRERGLALALEVPGTVPGVDKIEGDPVGVEPGSVRGPGPVASVRTGCPETIASGRDRSRAAGRDVRRWLELVIEAETQLTVPPPVRPIARTRSQRYQSGLRDRRLTLQPISLILL